MSGVSLQLALCVLLSAFPVWTQSQLPRQKAANDALQSQLSKEGKDCASPSNNYEDKVCIGEVQQQTEKDFSTFYVNLRAILDESSEKNLEDGQAKWVAYRDVTCQAIDDFFREGTARAGKVARCKIQLTRSRMKDLDEIYYLPLHH